MEEPTRPRVSALFLEAHKRGVTRVALVYVVVAFAAYQVGDLLTVLFQWPPELLGFLAVLLRLGLPAVLIFSWIPLRAASLAEGWEGSQRVSRYADALALGVTIFGLALWGLKPSDGVVSSGAEVVAVLPFAVSGEGANHLAEGMTDLLAIALEGTGVVRTPNARIMARRFREAGRPTGEEVPAILALGAGAGSVLTGSVTARGAQLEVSATLRRTDGWQLAEAHAEGRADDLPTLVDALTDQLVGGVWRSREAAPESAVGSVTTDDPEAMNHYLRGEALFRRGQWRAASASFSRAVATDTTFALGYTRLADTYGWADGVFTESADLNVEAAQRLAHRLPERRRQLVAARWRAGQDIGDRTVSDSLQVLLEAYPDDLEALHVLAEIGFHQRAIYGLSLEELAEPVERLLAVDSTMTAGLVHPIEVALQFGDRDRFERYLGLAEATGLPQAVELRRAGDALWEDPEARGDVARELMVDVGSAFTYTVGAFRVGEGGPSDYTGGLDQVIRLVPAERKVAMWRIRTMLLTATGRVDAAEDTARLDVVPTSVIRDHLTHYPAVAGFIDPAAISRGRNRRASDSLPRWDIDLLIALAHFASGDGASGEAALADLRLADVSAQQRRVASGLVGAARGWAILIAGDTADAIERMRSGLTEAGRWTESGVNAAPNDELGALGAGAALSFRLVAAMASWTPTAAQGRRLLHDVLWPDFHYEVLRHYELGRALEWASRGAEARESYDRFLRLLEGADEGLLVADEMAWAREALTRLAG
jgi:hypothetical protein